MGFSRSLTYKLFLAGLFSMLILAAPAMAHKVMIFGWVEGDMVRTISKFNGGKKVRHAPVSVFDTDGTLLLTGKTDVDGGFAFKRPDKKRLTIELEASMGHKTSCNVDLDEVVEHGNDTGPVDKKAEVETKRPATDIEAVIEKALDRKTAIILQKIQENEEKQSLSEIIGGIGYILGLVGIALWFKRN